MAAHRPTLIRAIKSVMACQQNPTAKHWIVERILDDAKANDPTLDVVKLRRGAGIGV